MLIQICIFSRLIPQKWIKSICHLKEKRQDLSSIIKRGEKNPLHFETIAKMLKTYFFSEKYYVHMVFFKSYLINIK